MCSSTGYEIVFAKEMAYYFTNRPDPVADIPKGYTHTFIIRNPQKSIKSLYAASTSGKVQG